MYLLADEPSHTRAYRYSMIGDKTLYISTTIVDSFSTPSKFVVTCKPLNATLGVFWQFIFDKRINVVMCLNKLSLIADVSKEFCTIIISSTSVVFSNQSTCMENSKVAFERNEVLVICYSS